MRLFIAIYIMSSAFLSSSALGKDIDSIYLRKLKSVDFGASITSVTKLRNIYVDNGYNIFLYENEPPDSQHANFGIVVFNHEKYSHFYSTGDGTSCRVRGEVLRCPATYPDDGVYIVQISDILAGRPIVIDGQYSEAWRGQRLLHPSAKVRKPTSIQGRKF